MSGATTTFAADSPASVHAIAPPAAAATHGYLHGPTIDFLLMGGASFLLFPLVVALPESHSYGLVAFVMLLLANAINHPHFAHSYQIFYRGFGKKLRGTALSGGMRVRYAVAGLLVPFLLIAYFAVGVVTENARLVALGGNIMALFVGWHYVKQGYGMLMVDAVLKRRYFSDPEKRVLLVNAYSVWGASWLFLNSAYSEKELWGLHYITFAAPMWLLIVSGIAVAGTSLAALHMLWSKHEAGKKLPAIGVMAYAVTLYMWVLFARLDPLWLLVVPALHSLQYLAVVYRFQTNFERARAKPGDTLWAAFLGHRVQLTVFALLGLAIGASLFWLVPNWLDARVQYDKRLFGPTLFLFVFWVSVNVHHYFIDSVMWRRENPETKLHLFS